MSLQTNLSNLRSRLKIDPNGRVWSDDSLKRFLNMGQQWVINDPAVSWEFQETYGYLIPVEGFQEYRASGDDDPLFTMSPQISQFVGFQNNKGNVFGRNELSQFSNNTIKSPSLYTEYAGRIMFNAGYKTAATFTTLHNMDSFNGNGIWTASNDATNVNTDAVNFKQGLGSVTFDITVATNTANRATISNNSMAPVNLSSFKIKEGGVSLWVYIPTGLTIEALRLTMGSSNNDNQSSQAFTDSQGRRFKDGWNRVFFQFNNVQTVGNPNWNAVNYLKLDVIYPQSQADVTGVLVDYIQFVDKYALYYYTLKAADMVNDSDDSIIPSQYQRVYERYAEYEAWSILSGREQKAELALQQARMLKNQMIDELQYKTVNQGYAMPVRPSFDGFSGNNYIT